jgi:hypothetical protein
MKFNGEQDGWFTHVIAYCNNRIVPGLTNVFQTNGEYPTLLTGDGKQIQFMPRTNSTGGNPVVMFDHKAAHPANHRTYTVKSKDEHSAYQMLPSGKVFRLAIHSGKIQGIKDPITEILFMFKRSSRNGSAKS